MDQILWTWYQSTRNMEKYPFIYVLFFLQKMLSMHASSVVDRGFKPQPDQFKYYKIGICCFSAKHAVQIKAKTIILTQQSVAQNKCFWDSNYLSKGKMIDLLQSYKTITRWQPFIFLGTLLHFLLNCHEKRWPLVREINQKYFTLSVYLKSDLIMGLAFDISSLIYLKEG